MASQVAPGPEHKGPCVAWEALTHDLPLGECRVCATHACSRSAAASALGNLVLGVFFLLRYLEATKASRILKTTTTQKTRN